MSRSPTGRHLGARRSGRAPLWLVALVLCPPCLALVGLGLMRSSINGEPASSVIAQKGGQALREAAAGAFVETTTTEIVTDDGQKLSVTVERLRVPKSVAAVRTIASVGAVVLLLYLVYVLVDGATRGRFRGVAFTLAAVAFVGSCVAVVKLS